jgi:zinc protease
VKNYQLPILIASLLLIFFSSCRSIDTRKQMEKVRDELDKKEAWRYDLPSAESAPVRPLFPKVQKSQLKNGLTVMVVEDHRLPIAQISLVTKNGSARDPIGQAGINNLTNLMLKEGTRKHSSLELAEAFANLGSEVNVSVDKDMGHVSSAVLSDKVDDALSLISSMVKEPRMQAEDFSRIKLLQQSLLSSHQGLSSYVAQTHFLMAAYGEKHPYAYPSAGTLKTISPVELKDIKKTHQANFGANISVLIVVGDVTLKQVEGWAQKYFGDWKKVAVPSGKIPAPAPINEMQTKLIDRKHSPQALIVLGQPAATQKDQDLPTLIVFQNILAGLPTSRLDENLRERKGWTYGVSSQISPLLGKGPMLVSSSIQLPFAIDAINEIMMEFDRLKKSSVSDEELSSAKNGLLHSFADRYSTVGKIANILANQFIYALPNNSEEILYDKISEVTKDDLLKAANRVLKKEHMVAVAVGDVETMETPVAGINLGKVTIERETLPVEQP